LPSGIVFSQVSCLQAFQSFRSVLKFFKTSPETKAFKSKVSMFGIKLVSKRRDEFSMPVITLQYDDLEELTGTDKETIIKKGAHDRS